MKKGQGSGQGKGMGRGQGQGSGRGQGGRGMGMGPQGGSGQNQGGGNKNMNQATKAQSKIVCVTAAGPDPDSQVDPMFGRCQYFAIIDLDAGTFRAEANNGRSGGSGVGIGAVQFVAREGVDTVVTGKVGPKAANAFNVAGIKAITGASGTVRDAVQKYFGKKI
ncbi:MAG: NifB/NifX family molybdenum-iron cluster-binding protein [Candidatus Falkowbacteria bacterium]